MRFAIATVDRYLGVFEALVFAGWKPVKLFTMPARSEFANQQAIINHAEQHAAAIQMSPITEYDMRALREQGCDALIVASYDWRVGDWTPFLKYAVNFHSSPLPEGRGPYPVVRAILENRDSWAVTCHRVTPQIDRGDILGAEKFSLHPDECHESLDLKIQMAAKRLTAKMAGRFAELWEQAKPQGEGSYWKKHKLEERAIDFTKPVEHIMRHIRAFGTTESLAHVSDTWLTVKQAAGWTEKHGLAPGHVAHVFNRSIVVAASDGYIALLESDIAPINVIVELQAELQVKNAG